MICFIQISPWWSY